ncbi:MAG TPA: hypothetical protein VHC95_02280 [Opitutales bacterium]|nr:hypothetical protein [Opitutales bacterium]
MSLAEWLAVATQDLAPLAQSDIRKETEARYAGSLRTHSESGQPEAVACAAALAELGDAQAARQRFRRTHLSLADARQLLALDKFHPYIIINGLNFGLILILAIINLQAWPGLGDNRLPQITVSTWAVVLLAAILLLADIFCKVFSRLCRTLVKLRQLLWIRLLGQVMMSALILRLSLKAGEVGLGRFPEALLLCWFGAQAVSGVRQFRLVWKLAKVAETDFQPAVMSATHPNLGAVPLLTLYGLFQSPQSELARGLPLIVPCGKQPADVAEWLELATEDLVPSAQARIRQEIGAHYAEAVRVHQEGGLPETQAHAAALADLGNAYSASLRFNRQHLTNFDVRKLMEEAKIQIVIGICWVLFYYFSFNWAGLPPPLGCLAGAFSGYYVYGFIMRFVNVGARRTARVVSRFTVILVATLAWVNVGMFLSSNGSDSDPVFNLLGYMAALGFALIALSLSLQSCLWWKKLPHPQECNLPLDGPAGA